MAEERERESEYEDDEGSEVDEAEDEEDEPEPEFEQPFCPRCGWHNTRPSHTSNLLDMMVRMFGFRPYRCRSCGNRFRSLRRVKQA
jgi:hypothetical protein